MSRPEYQLPAEFYYNMEEAKKYTDCTRIIEIQSQMTERALELLNIPENDEYLILDVGCGSGISGSILSENGHTWLGLDISRSMLDVAVEREVDGDLYEVDIGEGFNFRPGVFDAVISISALQWLCVAAKKNYNPFKRLNIFFASLYKCLRTGGRAVLQFYPDGKEQIEMITTSALKQGFSGGIVVDFPNSSKMKKLYLVIDAGGAMNQDIVMVDGLKEEEEAEDDENSDKVTYMDKKSKKIKKDPSGKIAFKSKKWIQQKKDRQRKQGKDVRFDSKYTGRNRGNFTV